MPKSDQKYYFSIRVWKPIKFTTNPGIIWREFDVYGCVLEWRTTRRGRIEVAAAIGGGIKPDPRLPCVGFFNPFHPIDHQLCFNLILWSIDHYNLWCKKSILSFPPNFAFPTWIFIFPPKCHYLLFHMMCLLFHMLCQILVLQIAVVERLSDIMYITYIIYEKLYV